jgi:LPXTG-motif cell wall-anchored protein
VQTLYDAKGKVIAEGKCGAPGETTVVTERPPGTPPAPPTPKQPPLPKPPTRLAETGSDGWAGLVWGGIAASLIAAGGTLWFGRRLALHRDRNGHSGEEDTEIEDLMNE